MPLIQFDAALCGNLEEALKHEWLETNGLGGFASSTVTGANTRRYHGLLIAATEPPAVRHLLLSKMEETLIAGDRRFDLSCNLYPGTVHPDGYRRLVQFRLDPFPVSTFEAGGTTIEKRVFMLQGENGVVVEYTGSAACRLEVRPLIAFRGYHDLTQANRALDGSYIASGGLVSIQPYATLPRLFLAHNAKTLEKEGHWYLNLEYPVERERGLDFHEDLYCPFVLGFDLAPGEPAVVIASTVRHNVLEAASMKSAETAQRLPSADPLPAAASRFIVRRGEHRTVIAGYPWFTDWGRDTMISLPGLTLATGRLDVARDVLLAFAACLDRGMLPNRFPDAAGTGKQALEYNTADATLWFFEAIRCYLAASRDSEFVRVQLYDKLKDIVAWHLRGTRFGIRADTDGLLNAGDRSTSLTCCLTWMDARVGGKPVTPRNGKPVEIQALWYNALRFVAQLADDFADREAQVFHQNLAAKAGESFNRIFWDERSGYLCDVIDADGVRDLSLRPNQTIALSLGYCAIPDDRARKILAVVEKHLLTPFGLRTLSPFDPRYAGIYRGSPAERDSAYHQGTVWPWLLGPFIAASKRFNGEGARDRVPEMLEPLRAFALSRGVGQLPEIFDGDAPHEPRGCFAQAWSVAEILRACSPEQ